jgi:MoaA/NifB/PqqE/SkfB family radical SAM enzyme
VNLQTNGVMMTPSRLEPLRPMLNFLNISVDAATEETYRRVRRGGNFQAVRENVRKLDDGIRQGLYPCVQGWQVNLIV